MPEKIEYRVEQLESSVCNIGADVKLILTNHLPHIEKAFPELELKVIDKLDKAVAKMVRAVGIGFSVVSILIVILKFVA